LGKIAISERILNKTARFDDDEFVIMKTHTVVGAGLVRQVFGKTVDQDMLRMCVNVVQYHHEKWDGTGYPIGLAGTKIPLCARIMAIADVFDALVSKRIYKDSIPIEEVFEIIRESAGTQFDPELAEIFLGLRDQICDYIIENSEQMTSARKTVDSDGDDRVHDVVELEDLEEVV
ncbi:MAG: HD domain-containing protein, partial [Treponema sp.]|nr:HD domain-containing protein [Candidatus Treponema equifaecale]